MFNKKASLEISIQAIVIVVLAMTLLGLGLGFIRGMFKNLGGTTEDVTEQIREQVLSDLRTGDKKISFPKTEITIPKGGDTILNVGIRNKENTFIGYCLEFIPISWPDTAGSPTTVDTAGSPTPIIDIWFQQAGDEWILDAAESDIRSIRVNIPKGVLSGSYAFTFNVVSPVSLDTSGVCDSSIGIPYASKDFFIVVTG